MLKLIKTVVNYYNCRVWMLHKLTHDKRRCGSWEGKILYSKPLREILSSPPISSHPTIFVLMPISVSSPYLKPTGISLHIFITLLHCRWSNSPP